MLPQFQHQPQTARVDCVYARQVKDEYATPPPVCVVLARAADRWLAAYAQVDQTLTYPLDPVTTGQTVAGMLRAHRAGAIPLGTLGHLG